MCIFKKRINVSLICEPLNLAQDDKTETSVTTSMCVFFFCLFFPRTTAVPQGQLGQLLAINAASARTLETEAVNLKPCNSLQEHANIILRTQTRLQQSPGTGLYIHCANRPSV